MFIVSSEYHSHWLQYLVFQVNKFYADRDWTIKKRGLLNYFLT